MNPLIPILGTVTGIGGFFGIKKLLERRKLNNERAVAHLHAEMAKVAPKE